MSQYTYEVKYNKHESRVNIIDGINRKFIATFIAFPSDDPNYKLNASRAEGYMKKNFTSDDVEKYLSLVNRNLHDKAMDFAFNKLKKVPWLKD